MSPFSSLSSSLFKSFFLSMLQCLPSLWISSRRIVKQFWLCPSFQVPKLLPKLLLPVPVTHFFFFSPAGAESAQCFWLIKRLLTRNTQFKIGKLPQRRFCSKLLEIKGEKNMSWLLQYWLYFVFWFLVVIHSWVL